MPEKEPEKFHWGLQSLRGAFISDDVAAQFEDRLNADPFDKEARAVLLGYCSRQRMKSEAAARKQIQHVLWLLENAPDCGLGNTPFLHISRSEYPSEFERSKEIILRQCEKFKNDPELLMHLGCVLRDEEPEIAIRILRQAHAIAAEKTEVAFWLSQALHRSGLQNHDRECLREAVHFMQEYVAASEPNRTAGARFWLAKLAFDSGQFDLADDVCRLMLQNNSEDNQAVHVAHMVFGSIAFKQRNIPGAVNQLRLAGKVGGSPRLCSCGPLMTLAQDLLEAGETEQVIQYLTDCMRFWEMGQEKLPRWIQQIKNGETPKLQGDAL